MINFAERLKAARKMKGWSLDELSKECGANVVSKQSLSKYEQGEMLPGDDILYALCKALDIKTDYFNRRLSIRVKDVSFRKLESYSVAMQEKVISQTQDFLERYLELEEILGIDSKFNTKKFTGYKITCPDDVEDAAKNIRKAWKLGNDPLYNVVELLEDHHLKVVEVSDADSFMGMSTLVMKKIPVIVLNNSEDIPNDRRRFTALHELGHIVMDLEHLSENDQETYCHHFAGAMLITKDKLVEELGSERRKRIFISELGQLKKQYGISISALLFRMADCKIIPKNTAFAMMGAMRRDGIFEKEPEEYDYQGEEKSNRFLQLLLRGVAMELISTSKGAALYNCKLSKFRALLA
ncbi:MAG: XRE family transcriptional regulator [Crocinitomicaceae bacterium]